MKNAIKSLIIVAFTLVSLTTYGEKMYVVSGKCNVPLTAGMNSAKYQIFTWDGSNAATTTDISSNVTGTGGSYYNSTSLALNDLKTLSNYSTGSSSARTMQAIKLTGSTTMTLSLGSKTMSKVIVVGRANSTDNLNITILGETINTNSKNFFVVEKEQTFSGSIVISNTTSKEYNFFVYLIEGVAGPVAVTGVSLNKTSTSIEAGQTETLTATVAPSNAGNQNVNWISSNTSVATVDQSGKVTALAPGNTTITVTTEDGSKTATCAVTVTAPAAPIAVTAINLNKSTASIYVGSTETLTITYTPTDANTGKAVSWTSSNESVATVDANGTVTAVAQGSAVITATSTTSASITASCTVTVNIMHVTDVSLNKTALSLQTGATETLIALVLPSTASDRSVTWSSSNTAVATVNNGTVTGVGAGTATITVTTVDGEKTATCTVTVTAGPPVPSTSLSLHAPEVYEAKTIAGGYNTPLVVPDNDREYEVYYFTRDADSKFCVATTNADKTQSISNLGSNDYSCRAKDGWFSFAGCAWSSASDALGDEFGTMSRRLDMDNTSEFSMHISGFDQFAIVARDKKKDTSSGQTKPEDNRFLEVYIDNVLQAQQFNTNPTIRRYNMTAQEHVIRVVHHGTEKSAMYAFSLRVSQEPRTKWLKGNDSSQVVLQTTAIQPIRYVTKYNNIAGAETRLIWEGAEGSGIQLDRHIGSLTDTLVLSGIANCPVGIYRYHVSSYYNGIETSRANGSFQVVSSIKATSELNIDAYQNEDIEEPITFRYYALDESDVQLTWTNGTPDGISGSGNSNGIYTISGRPTTTGTYPYSITVTGGDTVLTGKVVVRELNLGNNPILYLHKNNLSYENDPVFQFLTSSTGGNKNLIARKARREGLRSADQYAPYKWILISEDADADNEEVLGIIRGKVALPVLNMKGFTYTSDRLGWGNPDNGTVDTTSHNGCNIYIQRNDHPIFAQFHAQVGDKLPVFEKVDRNGIMPIAINSETMQNTLCLATGYTRNIENYDTDGELQTAIHEIPASMRECGKKYICMPMAIGAGNKLTSQGKTLIDAIINYLLNNSSAAPAAPQLQINEFSIMGVAGTIDQIENTIVMSFNVREYPELELNDVVPQITLADPTYTFVTPASGETVDFQYSTFLPVKFVVSDYISSRVYNVSVRSYDPEDIENVYESGAWVNIFDIYGRKIATTNEDIYTMDLPHGIYLVVTENGQTIKLMR